MQVDKWCVDGVGCSSGQFPDGCGEIGCDCPSVVAEQDDEWDAGELRYFSDASMQALNTMNQLTDGTDQAVIAIPELTAA